MRVQFELPKDLVGHLPYGGVDWNTCIYIVKTHNTCHLPCGGVDWN